MRNWFFGVIRRVLERSAFEEYNGPMLESLDLYAAKSGEELANEQTYNFTDRGDRRMAIRPEMTPTVARMVAGKMGELNFPLKWFSIPNMYRNTALSAMKTAFLTQRTLRTTPRTQVKSARDTPSRSATS